jgi:hypothetical protein
MNIKENLEKVMSEIKLYFNLMFIKSPVIGLSLISAGYLLFSERENFQMLFSILAGFVMYFNSML